MKNIAINLTQGLVVVTTGVGVLGLYYVSAIPRVIVGVTDLGVKAVAALGGAATSGLERLR